MTEHINSLLENYIHITCEYKKLFLKNNLCNLNKYLVDNNSLNNIFIKGLQTIHNIYKMNIVFNNSYEDITMITQKAYVYYIEFVNQIYSSNLINNYELSLNDAVLFCYKKTIFLNDKKVSEFSNNDDLILINYIFLFVNILLNYYPIQNDIQNINFVSDDNNENLNVNDYQINLKDNIQKLETFFINKYNIIGKLYKKIKINILENTDLSFSLKEKYIKKILDFVNNKYLEFKTNNSIDDNNDVDFTEIDKYLSKKHYTKQ